MQTDRRPGVLLAAALGLLVLNGIVLVADDGVGDVSVDDVAGAPTDATPTAGDAAGAPDEATEVAVDPAADDATGGATDGAETADGGSGESTGGEDTDTEGTPGASGGLGVPTAGTYEYASGGSWSLSGGAQEDHQLPATATAVVEVDGGAWGLRLVAGERYADSFGFELGPDGGLDWGTWVLDRTFDSGASTASYSCSSDSAHYRPDEQGRFVDHVCEGPGITADGDVEHVGREDVTLGDGSVVAADRLLYTYTLSGDAVTGEGRFDLWIDPATGLRVREVRSIRSDQGGVVYTEDVEFRLQSLAAG